jgi:uncharacterized membrane protein YkvA (DUF1232 family)
MTGSFSKHFSEKSLWKKIGDFASTAGQQVIYAVLLLYFVMKDPSVNLKHKMTIAASLGYFIFPLDAIPDLTPLIGFSDDLGVLIFALSQIYSAITPDIRNKARQQMLKWFGKIDEKQVYMLEQNIYGKNPSQDPLEEQSGIS